MGLFDRLFRSSSRQTRIPLVKLGRYSDSYKKPSNYEAWDRSLRLFDEGKYLESYREFFHYLRDEEEDNVFFSLEEGKLSFEIFQGQKTGRIRHHGKHQVRSQNRPVPIS
ncbi:MAG: hypothetical protein IPN74_06445 [Haliscomenobacter sp.]|nr:hypothetical protein [Haliscomenobacter sp.]